MIGVIAKPEDDAVVREFFELFKTPWEPYRRGRPYEALLCADGERIPGEAAAAVVLYSGRPLPCDGDTASGARAGQASPRGFSHRGARIPVYLDSVTFPGAPGAGFTDRETGEAGSWSRQSADGTLTRIGYDLFAEVRLLLTAGQPPAEAATPALDRHVALLRETIAGSGARLIEVPPVPAGGRFLACLTHDVDHPVFRPHGFDHTAAGFLYRATLGSLAAFLRGRLGGGDLLRNWRAALTLPLAPFGLARDLWAEFPRYLELEGGRPSSFFVIPFKDRPGRLRDGRPAPPFRAARYGAADIEDALHKLQAAGCEIGLHGLDAWQDSDIGRQEVHEIARVSGSPPAGTRMHWLYFDSLSAAALEEVGLAYDSTVGYNETVGFRAGTAQVYKPLAAASLLELPLHIMDTALFLCSHLNLSAREAEQRVAPILDAAEAAGGCITVNWHDRSIAPERLWGGFYRRLMEALEARGARFLTAAQAVAWFRRRRSAVFERVRWSTGSVTVRISIDAGPGLPDLQLRIYPGDGREPRTVRLAATPAHPPETGLIHLQIPLS